MFLENVKPFGGYEPGPREVPIGTLLTRRKLTDRDGKSARMVQVRLADTEGVRNRASMLLNRMYSWRGYGAEHSLEDDGSSVTFTASTKDEVIGTLTLTVDSRAGLAIDKTFSDELDPFRSNPGSRICELTKFAFNPSPESRPVLATLFHIIFMYGSHRYNCTDLFIEVNPRHVRFYEVMLAFQRIGGLRQNDTVGAPSQLMWIKVADIRSYIDLYAGRENYSGHSLYPHFFSRKEEDGLFARITRLAEKRLDPVQTARKQPHQSRQLQAAH